MNLKHVLPLGLILLCGCVPDVTRYSRFDVPGAVYLHGGCTGTAGPPTFVYYPFHGIYVSLLMRTLLFGLHVPSGTQVQLNDSTIQIDGISPSGPYHATFGLRAAPQGSIGGHAATPFLGMPDPYTTPDNFGPLVGASNGNVLTWFLYLGMQPENPQLLVRVPLDLIKGTIQLPSLTINGQRYESQILPFTQDKYVGTTAVNGC